MRQAFIATIQVCIEAPNDAEATDWLGETMRGLNGLIDWQYLKLGGQWCYPTSIIINTQSKYKEGAAFK